MSEGAVDIENQYYNSKGASTPLCKPSRGHLSRLPGKRGVLHRHHRMKDSLQEMWSQIVWRKRSLAFTKFSRWRDRRESGARDGDHAAQCLLDLDVGLACLTVPLGCRGFKAYKQIVKLQFRMGQHENMLDSYR